MSQIFVFVVMCILNVFLLEIDRLKPQLFSLIEYKCLSVTVEECFGGTTSLYSIGFYRLSMSTSIETTAIHLEILKK
jgi:hypothetical protein